jgi:hypothetical protein
MADTKKTVEFQGEEPMGDASKYHPSAIVGFANAVDPAKVQAIGTAYEGIGDTFNASLKVFQDMAQRLSEAWTGEDACAEASRQLALLYIAAMTMRNNLKQIGGVIKNLGADTPDFSKQSFTYSGAFGIPTTSSYESTPSYETPEAIGLSSFKRMVTWNADYFAGKDVAPMIPGSPGGIGYFAVPLADGTSLPIDRDTPPEKRGLYAQYLLDQGNNGIFSTWQGIPQSTTLDLPPTLTNTGDKNDKDGKNGGKNHGPGSTDPGGTPDLGKTGMPKMPGGTPGGPSGIPTDLAQTGSDHAGNHPPGSVVGPVGTDLSGVNHPTVPGGTDLGRPPGLGGGTDLNTPPSIKNPTTGLGGGNDPFTPYTPGLGGPGLGKGLGKGLGGSNPLGLKGPGSTGPGSTVTDGTIGARGAVNAAAAEENAAMNAAAANAGKNGLMPMMPPMMGGAGGQQGQDRERSAWLTEDEDIWGADDDVAPPLIG